MKYFIPILLLSFACGQATEQQPETTNASENVKFLPLRIQETGFLDEFDASQYQAGDVILVKNTDVVTGYHIIAFWENNHAKKQFSSIVQTSALDYSTSEYYWENDTTLTLKIHGNDTLSYQIALGENNAIISKI